jgi:hypothetical protein
VAGTVAPLYLVDSVGDAMPTEQLSDMVAKLTAAGATNFQAKTLSGDGHSFDNWRAIKNEALAFVADALSVTSPTPAGLLNISTRARAATGDDVLIAGFIVGNDGGTKKLIVRAIGPSLTRLGVANALADPNLSLFDSSGKQIASNDDWRNSGQAQAVIDTGLAPSEDKESALIATLVPGAYTAVVTGVQSTQNIALVEVYDLDAANSVQLLNISTRGVVDTGDGVMIAGSIVGGTSPGTLVVRGLGPSLAERPAPIQDALPDPTLRLVDSQGTTVFSNDNWQDSQAADLIAAGLAPGDPLESGLVVTLPPGSYTSIFSDTHGATGVGLLEIYNISAGVGSPGG